MTLRFLRRISVLAAVSIAHTALGGVLSIGHRGDSLFAPENTMAAFRSALPKADLVELDGQVSKDGVLVVVHDGSVDRTTDGSGNVAALTLSQLKSLDAGSWFSSQFSGERVPTLEEALACVIPSATPLIERKAGSAALYVSELRRLDAVGKVVLQAFDWNFLAAVRALEPGIRLGALGSGAFGVSTLTSITNAGATLVAWEKGGVTPEMLNLAQGAGLQVFVWTVDGPEITHFIDLGVDGIISNDPGMVQRLRQPPTPSSIQLGKGLSIYWRMDDGVSNSMAVTVQDSRGTSHAILTRSDGSPHWLAEPAALFGGAIQLDGAKAFITLPRNAVTDIGTNGFAYSAWLKLRHLPSALSTSFGAILDSTNDSYVVYLDRSNKELRFKVTDANGHAARPGIPESALTTNQWLHVVAAYSGAYSPGSGQAIIYLNGEPKDVHTGNDASSPLGLTGSVRPGQYAAMGREGPAGGNYFSGELDDVAIWARPLEPAEVLALYAAGKSGLNLGDLLREPTPLLRVTRCGILPETNLIEIEFSSQGPWKTFRLLRADRPEGPFRVLWGLVPSELGHNTYRFSNEAKLDEAFFRIEGE